MAAKIYASLPINKPGDIRVVEIKPSEQFEDALVLELKSASLDDPKLPYECLSYTWGGPKHTDTFFINGTSFKATSNLFSALRRLREGNKPRTFWIDAVCINQQDVHERAEQVKQMMRIYKQAKTVWLDLGEEVSETYRLYNLMFALDKALSAHQDDTLPFHTSQFEELGLPPVNDIAWVGWQALLSRPYFTRTWVIQEFAVASELFVLLGKTFFPWENIYHIVSRMQIHGIGEENRPMPSTSSKLAIRAIAGKNGLRNMHFIRDRHQLNDPLELPSLLWFARFADSSEPKDKIFGILGLATDIDRNNPDFEIKYEEKETVAQLFTRIAQGMIHTKRSYVLDCLFEGGVALENRIKELPSWVPDWTSKRAGSPLGGLYSAQYHAADNMELSFDVEGNTLCVRGRIVDQILHVTSQFRPDTEEEHTSAYYAVCVVKWLREAFNIAQSMQPDALTSGGDNELKQQLWQTLICNKTHTDIPAPADYAAQFEALVKRQRFVEESLEKVEDESQITAENLSPEYSQVEKNSLLYRLALQNTMYTKKFCVTKETQLMGMVPGDTKPGDYVVIVAGSSVPFILRKVNPKEEMKQKWNLIQECYIHGVMCGEFAKADDPAAWDTFTIV